MHNLTAVTVLGLVVGIQASLQAVGIVLIYRASRFVNFAQGQLGATAAATLGILALDHHVPYWIALAAALVVGAGTAVAVERLLSWRLFTASRLSLMIATIGVSQLVLLLLLVGPLKINPHHLTTRGFPQPASFHITLASVVLDSSQVTTLAVGPLVALALFWFLARTRTGRAIRGASCNPDAARLAGVSVRRVSSMVWVVAGLVSSLSAILFAPSQPAISFGDTGPDLLLRALAAALIAGMTDFRLAFVAGLGIGVLGEIGVFYSHVSGMSDLLIAAVLVLTLAARGRTLRQATHIDEGLVVETSKPMLAPNVARLAVVRHLGKAGWVALFAVLVAAPVLPGMRTQERAVFLLLMVSYAMAALGLTVLTGWSGQLSLGQFAFLGVGAFTAAAIDRHDLGIVATLGAAGIAAAVASVIVGSFAVRFRGVYLAVTTLTFAFVARAWLFRQGIFSNGSAGVATVAHVRLLGLRVTSVRSFYLIGVVVLALTVLALRSIRDSNIGRAFVAVRDNDQLAAAHGLPPAAVKLGALALAGFVTGVGGGLWGMAIGTFSFASFDPTMSFVVLSCVIVGGIGSLAGPILGVLAVFAWPYLVPNADTLSVRSFTSGLLLLIVLLFIPGGVDSVIRRCRLRVLAWITANSSRFEFGPIPRSAPLALRGVSIAFGGVRAVRDATLDVGAGEIVGLIGGNGAGKSTLLNCISGHLRSDSGSIEVFGRDVCDLPPEFRPELGLGRTFQDGRLFEGLTVAETVMVALDRADRSGALGALVRAPWVRAAERRKRARAADIIERFGLSECAQTLTRDLSTGMRRACGLAATVAAAPALILLDEPTAGLAQREVEAAVPLLRGLRDTYGCAVVIVEHDMAMLMSLCDRVYCLEDGAVIAEGTPEQVRADPRVIASYLGTDAAAVDRSHHNGNGGRRRRATSAKG